MKKDAFLPIIEKYVKPVSIIVIDGLRSYLNNI